VCFSAWPPSAVWLRHKNPLLPTLPSVIPHRLHAVKRLPSHPVASARPAQTTPVAPSVLLIVALSAAKPALVRKPSVTSLSAETHPMGVTTPGLIAARRRPKLAVRVK
jgi:hypothetical protein